MSTRSLARKNRQRFKTTRSWQARLFYNVPLSKTNNVQRVYPNFDKLHQCQYPSQCLICRIKNRGSRLDMYSEVAHPPSDKEIHAGLDVALGRRDVGVAPTWHNRNGYAITWTDKGQNYEVLSLRL